MLSKEKTWEKLLATGKVEGPMPSGLWDLSGLDLTGADLIETDLRGVIFRGANLTGRP